MLADFVKTLLDHQSLQDHRLLICPCVMASYLWQVGTRVEDIRLHSLQQDACDKVRLSDGYVLLHFSVRAFVQTFSLFCAVLSGQ